MDEVKGIRIVSLTGEKEYGIKDSEVRQDVQQIVEGAPETFDTFREIAEYIAEDGATAAEIIKNVAVNAQGLADEITRAKAAEAELEVQIADEAAKATAAVAAEKARAEQAERELREEIANAGTGDVTTEQLNAVKADVQANTTAINDEVVRATQAELDAVERGRQLALRSLYVAAGAEYNDTDTVIMKTAPWGESVEHLPMHYYLNGLGDITEEQMAEIYRYKDGMLAVATGHADRIARLFQYNNPLLRTLFNNVPAQRIWENKTIGSYYVFGNKYLEVLSFQTSEKPWDGYSPATSTISFYNCSNLKAIVPAIVCNANWNSGELTKLEHIRFKISKSVEINAPIISKDSILYAIQNATPTSAITITLHADAYARLKDDADIVAALAAQPLITLVSA